MSSIERKLNLTNALEDYLETIQHFVDEKGFARVRDICEARSVKSGSASPAVKRLAEMGLIHHQQGEFITLTEEGEAIARRIQVRHDLLVRFFSDFLRVEAAQAEADACAIEHHLSDQSMDQLTRLFEFLQNCPEGQGDFLKNFHTCPIVSSAKGACKSLCEKHNRPKGVAISKGHPLDELEVGQSGRIARIGADEERRRRLLNLGFIPGAIVEMDRAKNGKHFRCLLNGHIVYLDKKDANAVILA